VHPFHTPQYIAEFILPEIEKGLRKGGRTRNDITLASSIFIIAGDTHAERERSREDIRQQIAFYASTPTYHPVFEMHGWQGTANELSSLAARGKWGEMPKLVTDGMLAVFAAEGSFAELPGKVKTRYAGLLDRIAYYHEGGTDEQTRQTIEVFHS
jgi:alkanesulfonate monooxygenase SsuD/methylene tetrahydromethanopterin reductase-like flavin-dependent oxidoreductase (luciferase family)